MGSKGPLDQFHKDCLRIGTIKCFACFGLYLKGREELVVTIYNSVTAPRTPPPIHDVTTVSTPNSNVLPPASPASNDVDANNPEATVLLIGAYAKYNSPYVWLRSQTCGKSADEIDAPLDLPSTRNWKARGLRLWNVLEEVVTLIAAAPPSNPWAVDFDTLAALPPLERALQAGALASFLRELYTTPVPYAEALEADMVRCLDIHFRDMPGLVPAEPGALPPGTLERLAAA